jgi:hypothetical protein
VTNNDPVTSNPFGKLIYPVKDDAVAAVVENELEITLLAQLAVPNNELVIPPLVILILPDNTLSEPVTRTDPLTIALPVNGNVGGAKLALVAKDAVPVNGPRNNDADTVVANIDPVTINPDGNVADPVKYDADIALLAQLDVPINVPVNEPVNEPVLICWELLTTPSVFNSFFTPSKKCAEPVSKLMVPVVVITPPLNPSPTVIDVTPEPAEDGAHDADTAKLDETAFDAVPSKVPVNEPVNDPVLI